MVVYRDHVVVLHPPHLLHPHLRQVGLGQVRVLPQVHPHLGLPPSVGWLRLLRGVQLQPLQLPLPVGVRHLGFHDS